MDVWPLAYSGPLAPLNRAMDRVHDWKSKMNIGKAAELSNLPAKTIRFYEEIDLIKPARAGNGYRDYSPTDIHRLKFLQRARSLGFSVEECRTLMSLYENDQRASSEVKNLALQKIEVVNKKIEELQSMRDTLTHLAENCHGDDRPDCPILDDIAGEVMSDGY